jgi:sterol O-acyltransferase
MFADREFYQDWWNSASYDEFARNWNKPVHHFLLRHCYRESMENLRISKIQSTALTFLLSALMHELVFVILLKRVRFYFFLLQMFQLPLIYMSWLPIFKGKTQAGNLFFWAGMYLGPPFLGVAYLREYMKGI